MDFDSVPPELSGSAAAEAISSLPPKTRAALCRIVYRANLRLRAGLELPRFLDQRLRQLADDVADYRDAR